MSICVNILEKYKEWIYKICVYINIYIYVSIFMIYGYLQDLFKENF